MLSILSLSSCFKSDINPQPIETVEEPSSSYILTAETDFNKDIALEAEKFGTTTSTICLSLLVCKLESTHDYEELIKKTPQELFVDVREEAARQKITLETLNEKYCLAEMLSDSEIYVDINSNNVTILDKKPTGLKENWTEEFLSALNS